MRSASFFLALMISCAAVAQQPPAEMPAPAIAPPDTAIIPARVDGVATVGDLARLQSQIMMAEARKKLVDAETPTGDRSGQGGAAGTGGTPAEDQRQGQNYDEPVVVGIHGSAASPYALVRISDSAVVSVRPGDALPGGFKVERVTPGGVTVRRNDRQMTLGFSVAVDAPVAPQRP